MTIKQSGEMLISNTMAMMICKPHLSLQLTLYGKSLITMPQRGSSNTCTSFQKSGIRRVLAIEATPTRPMDRHHEARVYPPACKLDGSAKTKQKHDNRLTCQAPKQNPLHDKNQTMAAITA